jgi:hypothetical protein
MKKRLADLKMKPIWRVYVERKNKIKPFTLFQMQNEPED